MNQTRTNNQTTKKKVITIIRKDQPHPIFPQFIWKKIVENYFRPIDAFHLGATCRKMRSFITIGMNRWWFYHHLKQTNRLPINGIKHRGDFTEDCFLLRRNLTDLTNKENIKKYLKDRIVIDNPFYSRDQWEISEDFKNSWNYRHMSKKCQENLTNPSYWLTLEPGYLSISSLQPGSSNCRWHWETSYYPYGHRIYNQRYRSKKNYYQMFIYHDYKTKRSYYHKQRKVGVLKRKVAKFEEQYRNYLWHKNELKKIQLYLNKYREDCPEKFESTEPMILTKSVL